MSGISQFHAGSGFPRFTIQPLFRTRADVLRGAGNSTNGWVILPDTLSPSLCAEGFLMVLLLLRQKTTISKVTEINFSNEVAWHTAKGQGA